MPAVQELSQFYQLDAKGLSKYEIKILEAELFVSLLKQLNAFHTPTINLNNLAKGVVDMSDEVLVRNLLNDLIQTGEYSLPGLARYTDTPEDVVYEIASGLNNRPSLFFARRVIELHREARKEIYLNVLNKILEKSVASAVN